ncbi:MAG: DinB family protein [Bacteroidia bacterium]
MNSREDIIRKIALDSWTNQIGRATKLIEGLTDERLAGEIAPGRNSGIYLLGHLTAVHDAMIPLLGLGEKLFPELEEVFLKNPDKSALKKPSAAQLRKYWNEVNALLSSKFENFTIEEWFGKHTSVSEEDFKKEPNRNRLNVVLGRISHLTYHTGQLALLNK